MMKTLLIRLSWPVLRFFESSKEPKNYKKSHRIVLNVVGCLFMFLSAASAGAAFSSGEWGALIPVVVFFAVGLVAVIVGALGSNAAVAKIWGNQ